jgi:hypothetical protein
MVIVIVILAVELGSTRERLMTIVPADSPKLPKRGYYMGVLPFPARGQSFEQAYKEASEVAELVPIWGRPTPFFSLASDLSGSWGDAFVKTYVRGNGMIPLIHMSFIGANLTLVTPPGIENATLSSSSWQAAYEKAAFDVVKASRPLFLSLGNEVNLWYEKYGGVERDPNGFQHFVSLYNRLYDEVKRLSPQTFVFCTFAREVVSENREADLRVLSLFNESKMDLLVFTSYPFAVRGVKNPSDLPDDYYSRALAYMPGKPFGFSELGWPANDYFGGEKGQAQFLTLAAGSLTKGNGVDLRILCWAWLHDLSETDQIGLMKTDGTPRLAYQTWQALAQELTQAGSLGIAATESPWLCVLACVDLRAERAGGVRSEPVSLRDEGSISAATAEAAVST